MSFLNSLIAVPFELEIPSERFAIECDAVVGGAVCNVESKDSFQPVVARMNEADFANEYFPAGTSAEADWPAMAEDATRKSGVNVDWFM